MPISADKLDANRRNAQQSTGPKTISGKAISSRNALKHGRYSDDLIIRDHHINENPEEYHRLLTAITNQLKPDNFFEESIVLKIANCLWRSRRVVLAEAALIREELADIDPQMDRVELFRLSLDKSAEREFRPTSRRAWQRERRSRAAQCLVPDRRYTHDLQLYEMRLDRQLARLYKLYYTIKQTSTPTPLSAGSSEDENRLTVSAPLSNGARHSRGRQTSSSAPDYALGTPQLAVGMPFEDRNATPNTKTTETNPTMPEPQQLTPTPVTDIDHLITIFESTSTPPDTKLVGTPPFMVGFDGNL